MPELIELKKALSDINAAKDKAALDKLRLHYLGRRGVVAQVLQGIGKLDAKDRANAGQAINKAKSEINSAIENRGATFTEQLAPIDVTAPFDANTPLDRRPHLLASDNGSTHPTTTEIEHFADIFGRMGFTAIQSREIDDQWHMFSALNFPEGHPARDDYDTFMTVEKDKDGHPFIAPAHCTTMDHRILKLYKKQLEAGEPIAVLVPDRVFRNEDVDPRHEHTFYQHDGIYVSEDANVGMLIAVLKTFFSEYFQKDIKIKTQPFYFPFTEPSFEFSASCVFCDQKGCNICSYTGWIELLGCGMIHPNVLTMAGIDPKKYKAFAWGGGIERPIMLKYGIEDVRLFESGRLDFLRQFK